MTTRPEPILVVLAAGIGSRYGAGVKQLAKVGPAGELIIDYSVYDAIRAGFRRVIFIIRRDIEADFRELIGDRLAGAIEVRYAFQDGDDLPAGFTRPEGRTKPWGTGHAVLACRELIDAPFAVINADDFYGAEAFRTLYNYLKQDAAPGRCALVSFILKNTLSDKGGVTRGVCIENGAGGLAGIHETKEISRREDGVIRGVYNGETVEIDPEAKVSMNFWGFAEDYIGQLETGFVRFLETVPEGDLKAEYLLPIMVDELLSAGEMTVDLLESRDRWFGITYQEDREAVTEELAKLTSAGIYPTPLF